MTTVIDPRPLPITGVVPFETEATIRTAWPSVTTIPAVSGLGQTLIRSIVLAPVGWALMLPFYFRKVLPFVATRYRLTTKRVMIMRGLKPVPVREISLDKIDDVKLVSFNDFFRAGDLDIISNGQPVLRLEGVPSADAFRHAILNACSSYGVKRA